MIPKQNYIVSCLIVLLFSGCFKKELIIDTEVNNVLLLPLILKLDGKDCVLDAKGNQLRCPVLLDTLADFIPFVEFNNNSKVKFNTLTLESNKKNNLGKICYNKAYSLQIEADRKICNFKLVFTGFPVVQVVCDSKIYDEPKTLTRINIYEPDKYVGFFSFAGTEQRGKHSRDYPKKSFGFTLWEKMVCESEYETVLLGLRSNSDWILNGAVVDPSRIRNVVSFEIWKNLNRSDYDVSASHIGIDSKPVELFFNNDFRGIYIFSENLNSNLLNAEKEAVLYKAVDWSQGAVRFDNYNPRISSTSFWNGWEQKFPDAKRMINWMPLNNLYEVVVDCNNLEFAANIAEYISLDNFIDYFLFLNLISAYDNTGKNIFLYKSSRKDKFQIIPWDLDGSWGILFDGKRTGFEGILSNNLYERLLETNPANYHRRVKERWFSLRENEFNKEKLLFAFDKYFNQMNGADIIEQENLIWDFNLDLQKERDYIEEWLTHRLEFLDAYFKGFE